MLANLIRNGGENKEKKTIENKKVNIFTSDVL